MEEVHEACSRDPLGGVMNWRELITPGAEIVPMRENDLSLASSFQSRISPSQDPTWSKKIDI